MRLNGWKSRAMVDRYADDVANQRALEAKRRKGDTFSPNTSAPPWRTLKLRLAARSRWAA
jgi:hypothetical protein